MPPQQITQQLGLTQLAPATRGTAARWQQILNSLYSGRPTLSSAPLHRTLPQTNTDLRIKKSRNRHHRPVALRPRCATRATLTGPEECLEIWKGKRTRENTRYFRRIYESTRRYTDSTSGARQDDQISNFRYRSDFRFQTLISGDFPQYRTRFHVVSDPPLAI